MTTLFTSAAMGLLSRTIQALLSKYLSEVDVEGVEVPSFADSSGWGVRLSNVGLREGIQLMVLPGTLSPTAQPDENGSAAHTNNTENDSATDTETMSQPPSVVAQYDEQTLNSEKNNTSRSWFSWGRASVPTDASSSSVHIGVASESPSLDDSLHNSSRRDAGSLSGHKKEPAPLALKVGGGGKIGVLDIRLVGKSVHVLVEDAQLTLEVSQADVSEQTEKSRSSLQDAKKDSSSSPSKPEPTTTGDRVLANNIIAKILATIPNLFLRDISLRIVLPETESRGSPVVVEVNVDFFSVTDNADFLMNFGATRGGERPANADDRSDESVDSSDSDTYESVSAVDVAENGNNFLTKRIRTGRGVDGGFTIRILTEQERTPATNGADSAMWARERWNQDTNFVFVRCSGFDLEARIFLGTKAEFSKRSDSHVEHEDVDIDSLVFGGCDYVAPGPNGPQKIEDVEQNLVEDLDEPSNQKANNALKLEKQSNGIQMYDIPSNFHRVARGLNPFVCSVCHHPSLQCERCWQSFSRSCKKGKADSYTPLGGLVCHVSIREPLELNIDRVALDTIASIAKLFTKNEGTASASRDKTTPTAANRKRLRRVQSVESLHLDESHRHTEQATVEELSEFPLYMQPEKIHIVGIYVSHLLLRFHVLKKRDTTNSEAGASFHYWEADIGHVACDHQRLTAKEKPFQDVQIGFLHCTIKESKGLDRNVIVSVGRQPGNLTNAVTCSENLTCWPSTASALLNLDSPLPKATVNEIREHGVHMRLCSVTGQVAGLPNHIRSANIFLDSASVDTKFSIKDHFMTSLSELHQTFTRPGRTEKKSIESVSLLRYKIFTTGGRVKLSPLIDATFPEVRVRGEMSSKTGFSLEAAIDKVLIQCGRRTLPRALETGLSLQQLALLPESVRFRILLFLNDLTPLQVALGLTVSHNSFLQCRAVNSGITAVASRIRQSSHGDTNVDVCEPARTTGSPPSHLPSREEMLQELGSLDNSVLTRLLHQHRLNLER